MSKKPKRHGPRFSFELKGKTKGQVKYIESIRKNTITICSGYSGTGKTLLAIGVALQLLMEPGSVYSKIIVVRPAVEACGEKIGFLPGSINEKMRPLIEPIIDNIRVFVHDEGAIGALLEPSHLYGSPIIDIIPMGYLRGRTLNNCVVIFDEAQNASPAQMKLFLTRIGQDCKVIIEGDVTQSDIFRSRDENGLMDAIRRLSNMEKHSIGIVVLEALDIQRNPIIAAILERYTDVDGI